MKLILVLVLVSAMVTLSGCGLIKKLTGAVEPEETSPEETIAEAEATFEQVYDLAVSLGFTGTMDELVELFKGETGPAGENGLTPYIGDNGNWYIGGTDLGVAARGPKGEDGEDGKNGVDGTNGKNGKTPFIGENGNWWIGDTDTGVKVVAGGEGCPHNYKSWQTGAVANCASIGYDYRECTYCGDVEYRFTEALGHTYGEGYNLKASGSKTPGGLVLYSCEVCGSAKLEVVPGPEYSEGLSYELIDEKEEYRVSDIGSCTDTEIIVPEEYEGLPVTEIGEKAFYGCGDVISITIPDTIVKIGDKAFADCGALEEVAIPDSAEIGLDVFRGSIKVEIVLSHNIVYVEAKEATCEEPGNVAHYYCEMCDLCYEDEEGTIRIYDVTIPSAHEFIDGYCNGCGTYQTNVLIVSVDEIPYLGKFPLGTLEGAIGLPDMVNVYTADGVSHWLDVKWELSTYDKSQVGTYTIYGHIISPEFHYAEGVSDLVEAQVDITDTMMGTADVVFVLDVSGSMGEELNNVKNNIVYFAEAIEKMGVSARWGAVVYSDYVDCGSYEDSQIVMNGAAEWFVSSDSYRDAIGNIKLWGGGDAPEVAVDGLMLAHTMPTRSDARVFYILLTDCNYKDDNIHGVSGMYEAIDILDRENINVSVITESGYMDTYYELANTTGGIMSNIYGDFGQDLIDSLVPIIYGEVID